MNNYPYSMTPARIGGVLFKNRIVSAPSTMHSMYTGELYPSEEAISFFEQRAKAGVGMVTVAGLKTGKVVTDDGEHTAWDVNQHNHRNKLVELAERVHFHGAKISMELIGIFPDGYTVSDGCSVMGWFPGHEITREAMEAFKEEWAQAAADLVDCGFDAILIHSGHSVPLAQFLSPLTNKRTDEYGGSTENRCRYLIEILDAIRARVGKKLLIEVRISGTEFEEGGIDIEEGIRIGELIQDHLDILQVSAGMHNPKWMTWVHPCGFRPPMPNIAVAEAFKKSGRIHVPIVALGAVESLDAAEEIIREGKADMVTMARSLIADPELIHKALEGRGEDVTPCVKCMRCHDSTVYGNHFQCTVNPTAGLEACLQKLVKAPGQSKKVAIIGGGPAGMRSAMIACDRGHQVTLFEEKDVLGGNLVFSDYVSFKYPLKNYKNWLIRQVEKRPIDIRLSTRATPEMVTGFDAVLVAVGAEPLILPIPGVEQAKTAVSVYGKEEALGKQVIVIGGGQVGCETALHLAKLDKTVTVLEMQSALAPDASPTHRDELMVEIGKEPGFREICQARCISITGSSVTYEKDGQQLTLTADDVILAAGMKARIQEADQFIGTAPHFSEIGDCVKARTVEWATKEAFYAAVNL